MFLYVSLFPVYIRKNGRWATIYGSFIQFNLQLKMKNFIESPTNIYIKMSGDSYINMSIFISKCL